MPELPEVEIVKQSLIKNVKSEKIIKVIVRNRNLRFKLPKNFKNIIEKQKIINVTRFSKYVIIEFSNNLFCVLHLGMSGTIHVVKKNIKKNKSLVTNSSFYHSPYLRTLTLPVQIHPQISSAADMFHLHGVRVV